MALFRLQELLDLFLRFRTLIFKFSIIDLVEMDSMALLFFRLQELLELFWGFVTLIFKFSIINLV